MQNGRYLVFGVVYVAVFGILLAVILFGAAGRTDIQMFWVYIAAFVIGCLVATLIVFKVSPELFKERVNPGEGEQDNFSKFAMTALLLGLWGIAGLDVGRFGWSQMPMVVQIIGLVMFAVGFLMVLWAMLVNTFFSSAVRMQEDRGQQVITGGPYQLVRHPGYTGGLMFFLGSALALGSWWALLPGLLLIPVLTRRTEIEDTMLQRDLNGYREYAQKVRYRLLPGVW